MHEKSPMHIKKCASLITTVPKLILRHTVLRVQNMFHWETAARFAKRKDPVGEEEGDEKIGEWVVRPAGMHRLITQRP